MLNSVGENRGRHRAGGERRRDRAASVGRRHQPKSDEAVDAPRRAPAPSLAPGGTVTPKTEAPSEARVLSSAFSAAARALRPSVVRIDVEIEHPRVADGATTAGPG